MARFQPLFMRTTLMILLLALCCGCESVRRVHVSLPAGPPPPLGNRLEFAAYVESNQDLRDALRIIGEIAQHHAIAPAPVRGDFLEGQGAVAAYRRHFSSSSWLGNFSWDFYCAVIFDPKPRRLSVILMNSRSDEIFDAVYRELQERLRERFGADRISTFWM